MGYEDDRTYPNAHTYILSTHHQPVINGLRALLSLA
jgi:hypothetical protein